MGKLRRIIFYFFIMIYLIAAPLTVLYALGYILSPNRQAFVQTGLVSLISDPSEASVWVNNILQKEKTPFVLRNLKPGQYTIRVSLPGTHPWQREVEIEPDRVLRFENFLLFPNNFNPELLTDFSVARFWRMPSGKNLLALRSPLAADLFLLEPEKNHPQPLFEGTSLENSKAEVDDVLPHPLGERVLVTLKENKTLRAHLVKSLFPSSVDVKTLPGIWTQPPAEIRWGTAGQNSFFYLEGSTLKKMDPGEEAGTNQAPRVLILKKEVRGFALRGRRLSVLDGQRRFLELTDKGKIAGILLGDPARAAQIFGPDEGERYSIFLLWHPFLFTPAEESFALFLSSKGKLFSNKLPYFLDEKVDEVIPAATHPRSLYRKGSEIWLVDFEKKKERVFFETGPAPRRLYRGRGNLSNLLWFYEDRYVLFAEDGRVKVLDFSSKGDVFNLLEISARVSKISLDEKRGYLYFAAPGNDRLSRVKLFETGGIFPRLMDDLAAVGSEKSR